MVVEDDVGGAVVPTNLFIGDAFAHDEPWVDQVGHPAAAVHGEVVGRAGQIVDDAPSDVPRVRHEQELVVRAGGIRMEALRVRRLVQRGDRAVREGGHPDGERVGRHEHVVVAVVHRRRGQVRVADLPQEVDLTRPDRCLLEPEHMDRDVLAGGDLIAPLGQELQTRRMARSLERALQGPREMVVAPTLDDVPARDADPERIASRRCPPLETVADRGRPIRIAMSLEDLGAISPRVLGRGIRVVQDPLDELDQGSMRPTRSGSRRRTGRGPPALRC